MSLDDKFIPIRTSFYNNASNFFQRIAKFYGYPENLGMPCIENTVKASNRHSYLFSLPKHTTMWPPQQRPDTWFEMIFGTSPKVDALTRYVYETKEEGFYNFYIENYRNLFFLPNWLSEFIQVRLNVCLDISVLETAREILFVGLLLYYQVIVLRIAIAWFIVINPYKFPWCYLTAIVDWIEDSFQGLVPAVLGVNITAVAFLGLLGAVGDALNHLVFTMPFLASEGEPMKILIDNEVTDVLVFHYLPLLWYRHPIPNSLREYWYAERPDILEHMQTAYRDLQVNFLPDNLATELTIRTSNLLHDFSSQTMAMHILSPNESSLGWFFHASIYIN